MQKTNWPSFIDKSLLHNPDNQADTTIETDLFIKKDGLCYAGTHLILDCWNARHLDELEHIEQALRDAVKAADATLLHIHLHHFSPNGGVSGVAVLAESHISIHTWPERGYAALDIFMCGDTRPEKTISIFRKAFQTETISISKHLRGIVPSSQTTEKNSGILKC